MTNDEKLELFKKELNYILDPKIKEYTEKALCEVPDYFFEVPASSTGKYHPAYALGNQGLLRHTRSAVRIAVELLNLEMYAPFEEYNGKDLIISALILHDSYKHGTPKLEFVVAEHPLVAIGQLALNENLKDILPENKTTILFDNIAHHMGQFVLHPKTKQPILEKPQNKMQNFVFMCDYLASRKCIEMNFEVEVTRGIR